MTRKSYPPFYVYVEGTRGWRKQHETLNSAKNEALRLSELLEGRKQVYILATLETYPLPSEIAAETPLAIQEAKSAPVVTIRKRRQVVV